MASDNAPEAGQSNLAKPQASAFLKFVRFSLGIALLGFVLVLTDPRSLLEALKDISLSDLVRLAVISLLLVFVSVIKWRAFLQELGISATVRRLFGLYLMGYFVNLLMPSVVGGDVVRSFYVTKGADRAHALSATILERYTGLVAMILMAIAALALAPSLTPMIKLVVIGVAVGTVVVSILLLSRALSGTLKALHAPDSLSVKVRRIEDGMVLGLSNPRLLTRATLLSFLFHVLTVANTVAAAWAVGWNDPPVKELFAVVPLILLVGAIPISPQGLGIQEGAFIYFLHSVGATTGQALALALVLRAKSYVLAILGGFVWFTVHRGAAPRSSDVTARTEV